MPNADGVSGQLIFLVTHSGLKDGCIAPSPSWHFVLSLFLASVGACSVREKPAPSIETVDSAGIRITTISIAPASVAEWRLTPASSLTLTGAETGDSAAFADIGAVRWLSDGRFLVADLAANRVLLFDSAGSYLRAFGRAGAGPGEFRHITSLAVRPGDTFVTFDARLRRVSLWQPDLGFLTSTAVGGGSLASWPADAWLERDGRSVVLQLSVTPVDSVPPGSGVRRWPMRARLTMHDTTGRLLAASPEFAGMYSGLLPNGDTRLPFSNQPFIAFARDRTYFGSGDGFALRYLDVDFNLAGEIRWPSQEEDLSESEVNAVRAEAEALVAKRLPIEQARQRLAPSFAPEILPNKRPTIGHLIVAPDGTLWVGRFEATRLGARSQKAPDRWTILSQNGEPLGRLALPAGSRLEAVRGAHVILVVRDSLDVQTVQVRELSNR